MVCGDHRHLHARQGHTTHPPIICLLVSDISRFRLGEESLRLEWVAIDAARVAQNILLFCVSVDLVARPRASMDKQKIKELLRRKDRQYLILNILSPIEKTSKHHVPYPYAIQYVDMDATRPRFL